MCDAQKTTMAATGVVNVDVALASVLLELENISSLDKEQRMIVKAFLDRKGVSLFSQLASVRAIQHFSPFFVFCKI